MLIVKFTLKGKDCRYEFDDSQRDVANDLALKLMQDPDCTALMCVCADGTAKQFKTEATKCYAVNVVFPSSDKVYPYGSKFKVETGDEVIVYTCNGIQIVTVRECTETEESNLVNLTNGKKPKWIKGKFIRF